MGKWVMGKVYRLHDKGKVSTRMSKDLKVGADAQTTGGNLIKHEILHENGDLRWVGACNGAFSFLSRLLEDESKMQRKLHQSNRRVDAREEVLRKVRMIDDVVEEMWTDDSVSTELLEDY